MISFFIIIFFFEILFRFFLFFLNSFAPIYEKNSYQYNIDWRYNEFANPSLQLIHCLTIEIFFYTGQENFNPWKLFAEPFIAA